MQLDRNEYPPPSREGGDEVIATNSVADLSRCKHKRKKNTTVLGGGIGFGHKVADGYDFVGDNYIDAFSHAYDDDVDVITASIGYNGVWSAETWAEVASCIVNEGIVVTIAVGNSGTPGLVYGSSSFLGTNVFAVASVDRTDSQSSRSAPTSRPAAPSTAPPRSGICRQQGNPEALGAEYILFNNNESPLIQRGTVDEDILIALVVAEIGDAIMDWYKNNGTVTVDFSVDLENPIGYANVFANAPATFT
ncbi:hypothetical protein F5B19DRAFT_496323 [Rostrohypoxylon terebratum]|nr:hypothetical protein F5B19DRAFT_496323 [Rostrohypoxylon terebratum]